ncbi:PAC2 family protein [Nakamurella antarctica]|uniref:PAC2 family protein n=1 Tax=Nakamurella antarctica TaxID=1902245 RepID=A0A3G8ZYS3_9ACTN|nr:PAC2 family protein [Nakamurella antarctica]AZI59474.1 PAC2 family protein [Nakamurella antarctica]
MQPQQLRDPVLIAAFEGWNDAGDAATSAVEHLALTWDATPLAEIDPENFYDFQVSRPTVKILQGVTRHIEWPTTKLTVCRLPDQSRDVILVHGIEPNFRWKAFCAELVQLALDNGVTTMISLGALLADVAHTRPVQVTGSAHDAETADQLGIIKSTYEGPTGISGVFQDACLQAGIPGVAFWASVPHYVSHAPSPKATLALLHRVEDFLDIAVTPGNYPEQSEEWESEVSQIAEDDDEISEYIKSLEERDSEEEPLTPASGDAIAAEFERYLRRRGPKSWGDKPDKPGRDGR